MAVNLGMLLPRYFKDVRDFVELVRAEETELEQLELDIGRVKDNLYIQTCDEKTLRFYERLLGAC